jgi:hypothetical protein
MLTETELLKKIDAFLGRISAFQRSEPIRKTVEELRSEKKWDDLWSASPGIYYFVRDDIVVYIGRALPGTNLGARINSHLKSATNEKWVQTLGEKGAAVGLLPFPKADHHWAAALELALLEDGLPEFNLKRG